MLTSNQWKAVAPLFKVYDGHKKRGRPLKHSNRRILSAVLWILKTGAPWYALPKTYPPYQTCHKRFQQWVESGLLKRILFALAQDLKIRGELNLAECYIDATFIPAKKGDSMLVKPNGERVVNSWQLQTAQVFLSPCTARLLHHMKQNSSKIQSKDYLLMDR